MSDKGKAEAIRILRKEVAYGCPICRSPFLTWHHFDPPWNEQQHWNPDGMIALCLTHHPSADAHGPFAGAYSKAELHAMKKRDYSAKDVTGDYLFLGKKSMLVRVGGNYTSPRGSILSVNHVPQISLTVNEAHVLSLSFILRNKADIVVARMEENMFTAYPTNVHYMTVKPETRDVRIWLDKEDVGLAFSFRQLTMERLQELLAADKKRADEKREELLSHNKELQELRKREEEFDRVWLAEMDPESQERIRRARQAPAYPPLPTNLPDEVREVIEEGHRTGDLAGAAVRRWVKDNCMSDDGLIPLLNFEEMAINHHGRRFIVKDGIGGCIHYNASLYGRGGGINFVCPCPACAGTTPAG